MTEGQRMAFERGVLTWWKLVLIHGVLAEHAAFELWGYQVG